MGPLASYTEYDFPVGDWRTAVGPSCRTVIPIGDTYGGVVSNG